MVCVRLNNIHCTKGLHYISNSTLIRITEIELLKIVMLSMITILSNCMSETYELCLSKLIDFGNLIAFNFAYLIARQRRSSWVRGQAKFWRHCLSLPHRMRGY